MGMPMVVLDNGGGYCKAGFSGAKKPSAVVPNCEGRPQSSKKWLIGDQIHHCDDIAGMSLRRPFDRGYLINPDMQRVIWDRIFKNLLKIRPLDSAGLLLVEPLFNLPSIQRATDELVFEDLGFQSLYVADAPSLVHLYEASRSPISLLARTQCSLVVDCGFSFTHAAPVYQNFTINYGVKRIDLGGKALTNYLKELVSYRAINMMDETYIMDDVKEKLCFVSLDVPRDLDLARKVGNSNVIQSTYVLPDGIKHKRGFVKDPEEAKRYLSLEEKGTPHTVVLESEKEHALSREVETVEDKNMEASSKNEELKLTNERFLVPEMLFRPADLGMNQAGLAECIVRAVNSCHPHLHPVLFSSIILTGGSSCFPHMKNRLEQELRPLVSDDYKLKIVEQEDPMFGAWRGGSLLAASPEFESFCVTKLDYEELGSARCRRRFMH